jgi:hypothetical protein
VTSLVNLMHNVDNYDNAFYYVISKLILTYVLSIAAILAVVTGNQVYAKSSVLNPDLLDYHLKLARGMLETCYTRDSQTDNLIPNPALPMLTSLAKTCDKKMTSLDDFLAKFVGDKDGKIYALHSSNKSAS